MLVAAMFPSHASEPPEIYECSEEDGRLILTGKAAELVQVQCFKHEDMSAHVIVAADEMIAEMAIPYGVGSIPATLPVNSRWSTVFFERVFRGYAEDVPLKFTEFNIYHYPEERWMELFNLLYDGESGLMEPFLSDLTDAIRVEFRTNSSISIRVVLFISSENEAFGAILPRASGEVLNVTLLHVHATK